MKRVLLTLTVSLLVTVGVAGPSWATDHPGTPNPNADCFSDCPVTPPVIPDPPAPPPTPVVPDSPYVPPEPWNPPVVEEAPPPADIPPVVAEAPPEDVPAPAPAPAVKPKVKALVAKGTIAPAAQKCATIPAGLTGGFSAWWLLPAAVLGFVAGAFTRRRRDDDPVDEVADEGGGTDAPVSEDGAPVSEDDAPVSAGTA